MPVPSRDKFDLSKQAKEVVNYRTHERCGNCGHNLNNGQCEVTDGNINSDNVCDQWTLIESRPYYNKDFYKTEFTKAQEPLK